MTIIDNFFRNGGLAITPLKEGISPLDGPRIRRYSYGVTYAIIDPSKSTLTITHFGNMSATDSDVVNNVQGLIQKLKLSNNPDGNYIESIFRKLKPSIVDGSPDYEYKEVYKLPKSI